MSNKEILYHRVLTTKYDLQEIASHLLRLNHIKYSFEINPEGTFSFIMDCTEEEDKIVNDIDKMLCSAYRNICNRGFNECKAMYNIA